MTSPAQSSDNPAERVVFPRWGWNVRVPHGQVVLAGRFRAKRAGCTPIADPPTTAYPLLGWMHSLNGILVCLFICGSICLSGYGQLRLLGLLMVGGFALSFIRRPAFTLWRLRPIPLEIVLFTAWVAWAGISGLLVAADAVRFQSGLAVISQNLLMVWVIYGMLRLHREAMMGVFLAIIAGGTVQIVAFLVGVEANATGLIDGAQRTGLTGNANGLGYIMNVVLLAGLFIWGLRSRFQAWLRIAILGLIPLCAHVLVASASRKSFFGFGVILLLWGLFASTARHSLAGFLARLMIFLMIAAAAYAVVPVILEDSVLERRLQELTDKNDGTVQTAAEKNARYEMYVDGFNMFLNHPVSGVGLDNFSVHFRTGSYSHSDYIEPLATTGLVGFLLYQSFSVFLVFKAARLAGICRKGFPCQLVRMILIAMIFIMLMGLGTPNYNSQMVFSLFAVFSVLILDLEQQVFNRS